MLPPKPMSRGGATLLDKTSFVKVSGWSDGNSACWTKRLQLVSITAIATNLYAAVIASFPFAAAVAVIKSTEFVIIVMDLPSLNDFYEARSHKTATVHEIRRGKWFPIHSAGHPRRRRNLSLAERRHNDPP